MADGALALAAAVALAGGYAAGSIPFARLVGARLGLDPLATGERNPGSANIWKLAGWRAGLLVLAGDLGKGIVPVAAGAWAVGWGIGWLAGIGAVLGHAWPLLGRWPGGRAVATFSGTCIALVPAAAAVSIGLLLVVLAAGRVARRNGRVAGLVVAIASFPPLALVVDRDPWRLGAVGVLYLVALARFLRTAHRPAEARGRR